MVRSNNEDNFYLDEKLGLLVVADGMGGHASGEKASNLAINVIRDYFRDRNKSSAMKVRPIPRPPTG